MLQIAAHELVTGKEAGLVAAGFSILAAAGDAGIVESDQMAMRPVTVQRPAIEKRQAAKPTSLISSSIRWRNPVIIVSSHPALADIAASTSRIRSTTSYAKGQYRVLDRTSAKPGVQRPPRDGEAVSNVKDNAL